MSRMEFDAATKRLRAFCEAASEQRPKAYESFTHYADEHHRNVRVDYDLQQTCRKPMTTGQEVRVGEMHIHFVSYPDTDLKMTVERLTDGALLC
jgi:hypothetical protein